jgi:tellurite resistance protein TerC
MSYTAASPLAWILFNAFVLALLALDLGVFHRKAHEVRPREALIWTFVWIALATLFGLGVYLKLGTEPALQYFTGYVIEKALSVDNIFVFIVILSAFAVPPKLQHRVLFWGVLGALVLRTVFILAGAALIERFSWLMYVLGAFLIFTGIRLLIQREEEVHPERNPLFRLFKKLVPTVSGYREGHFFVRENGRRFATPLFAVLVAIEATDVVFAVDSIPAIFAVTTDPFLVYTSNVFAILGLRSLYFALAGMMDKFHYLKVGLALVLAFVGTKMAIGGFVHVPVVVSLVVVVVLLGGSVVASLVHRPRGAGAKGIAPGRSEARPS